MCTETDFALLGLREQAVRVQPPANQTQFDPGAVLLPEWFDPRALLTVWCVRRLVYPVLWVGIAVAAVASSVDDVDLNELDSASEYLRALLSPLAGVVIAIALRLLSSLVGLVLAYRVMLSADAIRRPFESSRAASLRSLVDRIQVTRAFRNLRWTKAVRQEASDRIVAGSKLYEITDTALSVANVLLLVAMFVVASLSG